MRPERPVSAIFNALRDGLMALVVKFHKSIDPDDTTVELEASICGTGLFNALN
jgi:hypothetical protein